MARRAGAKSWYTRTRRESESAWSWAATTSSGKVSTVGNLVSAEASKMVARSVLSRLGGRPVPRASTPSMPTINDSLRCGSPARDEVSLEDFGDASVKTDGFTVYSYKVLTNDTKRHDVLKISNNFRRLHSPHVRNLCSSSSAAAGSTRLRLCRPAPAAGSSPRCGV